MKIIDGKALAKKMRAQLKEKLDLLRSEKNKECGLAVVLCGNDPASEVYVRNKIRACEEVGIKSYAYYLPEHTKQAEIEELVKNLASDDNVDGILVQLPLPKGIDEEAVLSLIPAIKDVDGFSDVNIGRLLLGKETLPACTPNGVIEMLKSENVEIAGKNAVVLGRSNIVGKPMAVLLLKENATVTVCHSKTVNLKEITARADILVSAIGKPKFVTADMVKEGSVVIDVGTNKVDGKLVGDVDFEGVKEKASLISPVPGGVGPMTITMLMYNTYEAAKRRLK